MLQHYQNFGDAPSIIPAIFQHYEVNILLQQVDEDFIAAYQASYGVAQESAGINVATSTRDTSAPAGSFTLQVGWVYVCSLLT